MTKRLGYPRDIPRKIITWLPISDTSADIGHFKLFGQCEVATFRFLEFTSYDNSVARRSGSCSQSFRMLLLLYRRAQ